MVESNLRKPSFSLLLFFLGWGWGGCFVLFVLVFFVLFFCLCNFLSLFPPIHRSIPKQAGWGSGHGPGEGAGEERPGAEEGAVLWPSPPGRRQRQRREWLEVSSHRGTRSCFLGPACLPFSRSISLAPAASRPSLPLFSPPLERSSWLQSSWQPDGLSSQRKDRDGKIF